MARLFYICLTTTCPACGHAAYGPWPSAAAVFFVHCCFIRRLTAVCAVLCDAGLLIWSPVLQNVRSCCVKSKVPLFKVYQFVFQKIWKRFSLHVATLWRICVFVLQSIKKKNATTFNKQWHIPMFN